MQWENIEKEKEGRKKGEMNEVIYNIMGLW